jgi:DNA-binding LacI/PurR family transcriptional regulator
MAAKRSVTIEDLARLAGVSSATVSRVLNSSEMISNDVQKKVLDAVQETNFKPRKYVRKSAKANWMAVLIDSFENLFFQKVLTGIHEQATDEGFIPFVIEMPDRESRQQEILSNLKNQHLMGIISTGFYPDPKEWIRFQEDIKVPIVVTNTQIQHPKIASIIVNFERAAYQATQHLLDLGHTKIAFMGVHDYEEFSSSQLSGVKQALEKKGYRYPEEYEFMVSLTAEGASQGVSRLLMLPADKRPTAIFAFDDELAIYAINTIRYYGLRIPEDISLIGFDNITMSAYTNPPLSTIDIPKRRIGRQAVLLLKELIENEKESLGFTFMDGSLIVRNSTGPVPVQISQVSQATNSHN